MAYGRMATNGGAMQDPNADIDAEIREAEAKVTDLKLRKTRLMQQSPYERVASKLHSMFCRHDHTEGCGWFYEINKEVDDWTRGTHEDYLKKAHRLCSQAQNSANLNANQVLGFLDTIEKAMRT